MTILTPTRTASSPLQVQLLSRDDLLPVVPDMLWRIQRGIVCTQMWNEEGKPIVLGYWGVGDVVGQPLTGMQVFEIRCLTTVEASILHQEEWQQALESVLQQAQRTEELLKIMLCQGVSQKLWQFLVFLSHKFGREVGAGWAIDLALTHQDIANAIGTTRVTVTRMLQQFEAEGKLRREKRQLILCQASRD